MAADSRESSLPFISRRSPVVSLHGAVASSQPLATEAGITILRAGGNAADAAVAVAACLNVTEPCSTGIGGDAFCLFYDAKTKIVKGINGRYSLISSYIIKVAFQKSLGKEKPRSKMLLFQFSK